MSASKQVPRYQSTVPGMGRAAQPYRYSEPDIRGSKDYFGNGDDQTPRNNSHPGYQPQFNNAYAGPQLDHNSYGLYGHQYHLTRDIAGQPNAVDPAKILQGIDVRTTVMLRNLPNNLDCHGLKALLDATSHGEYDFFYLRIDFKNNCNVGYGFVNFTDPAYIVKFIKAYVGRPWVPGMSFNRRRGPRIAAVSYATVQGYDCLVEKFRNSAVMCEFPDFRPKLFVSHDTAPHPSMVGREKEFPGPNNASKAQRSRDNAEHIGLFPPKGRGRGQNGGNNHHSQFDRGTPAQISEDAYWNGTPSYDANGYPYFTHQDYMLAPATMHADMNQAMHMGQYEHMMWNNATGHDSNGRPYGVDPSGRPYGFDVNGQPFINGVSLYDAHGQARPWLTIPFQMSQFGFGAGSHTPAPRRHIPSLAGRPIESTVVAPRSVATAVREVNAQRAAEGLPLTTWTVGRDGVRRFWDSNGNQIASPEPVNGNASDNGNGSASANGNGNASANGNGNASTHGNGHANGTHYHH